MSTNSESLRRLCRRQSPSEAEVPACPPAVMGHRRDPAPAVWRGLCPLEPRLLLSVSATFADEILTIASDADDPIVVTDNAGNAAVNGADLDLGGPVASADVVALVVNGGPGGNTIDLSGVTQAAFAALTSVTAAGAGGGDTIIGSGFADVLSGGAGNDTITGGGGADQLEGGGDDDVYVLPGGADTINDAGGSDTLDFSAASEGVTVDLSLDAGQVQTLTVSGDTLAITGTIENVVGSPHGDAISGNDAANTLSGGGGADAISGRGGNDIIYGQGGNDIIHGDGGDDIIYGDGGDDILRGGDGDDNLVGGAGTDTVIGGAGADIEDGEVKPAADFSAVGGGLEAYLKSLQDSLDGLFARPLPLVGDQLAGDVSMANLQISSPTTMGQFIYGPDGFADDVRGTEQPSPDLGR